ncbi:HelD family protein [Caproiciproducens sp. MSJ-32]|uniref:HelD family protein n=1 Tax=Caproiciproducens sp. MSJ-32 TaxID=2841527 RepID=UPI001C105244|nr:UvrD-helicase domain-containing protein [Caproiciproducens sp. MSJ-32]MBU5455989.1 AAA family ATPase [Caproiciproducens sp. MSJ-32]
MDKFEFLKEEEKLKDTLDVINEETIKYIEKRKEVSKQIVDNRKKFIEEYEDDEDRIIEYFDHEKYIVEELYRTIDKRLLELVKLKETPYFGKIGFIEDGILEEIYIGRYGLNKDESFEPVIVDWRAPVASLFYKGMLGKANYKTPVGEVDVEIASRRQLIIKKSKLEGYFDSDLNIQDEILQLVLSSKSGEKLKDIVTTIQKEQDEIIRADRNKVVVVNGVAGSGKTTIALHRVAYLLYNFRKQLENKVLILGPNDIFMDYISEVLPNLGETAVANETFISYIYKEIGLNEPIKTQISYLEEVLNGNEEVIKEIKYKSSGEFIKELDKKVKDIEDNYFNIKSVNFMKEEIVSEEEIKELFNKYYEYMPIFRRNQKIKRVLISKIKDRRDEEVRKINLRAKEEREKLTEDELKIQENNIEYRRRLAIRDIISEVIKSKEEVSSWIENESVIDIYKNFMKVNELSYLDLAGILYLMIKLEGKKSSTEIKHIVIDEAQDFNMLQFIVLKEFTGCRSYTIVGDTNQRLVKAEEIPAMLRLKDLFDDSYQLFELNKSYRSTYQIMEYANKFIDENSVVPFVRKGEFDVLETSVPKEDKEDLIEVLLNLLEDYEEEKYENIAIITKDKNDLEIIAPELKKRTNIIAFKNEDIIYKGGKVIIPSYFAKGLEFDAVIIVNFDKDTDNLIKYIMATRALHRLSVINII